MRTGGGREVKGGSDWLGQGGGWGSAEGKEGARAWRRVDDRARTLREEHFQGSMSGNPALCPKNLGSQVPQVCDSYQSAFESSQDPNGVIKPGKCLPEARIVGTRQEGRRDAQEWDASF